MPQELFDGQDVPTPSLGEPQFSYFSAGTHADLSYAVSNLGDDVGSITVRVARVQPSAGHASANANAHSSEQPVFEQTLQKPSFGWPSGSAYLTFPRLLAGWQYQVSLTLHTMVGTVPALGPRTVTVEAGSLAIPTGPQAPHAWTLHRWVADGQEEDGAPRVAEALAVGWRNVAPGGSGLYTLSVSEDGQSVPLTSAPVAGPGTVIIGPVERIRWCEPRQVPIDLTVQELGTGTTTGVILPRPDPDLCVDRGTGVAYTYTWASYGTDHLGTVRAVYTENPDGTTGLQTFDYEPFGVEIPGGSTGCGNTHRFTGHERDLETGNDYMHFRFYAAGMGRFQKPDSVFDGAAGNPQGFNLYSYVSGNPVNMNDPTGHWKGKGHKAMEILSFLAAGRSVGDAAKAARSNANVDKKEKSPVKAWATNDMTTLTETHGFSKEGESRGETIDRVAADSRLERTVGQTPEETGEVDHSRQDPFAHAGEPIPHGLNADSMPLHKEAALEAFNDTLLGQEQQGFSITSEARDLATQAIKNVAGNDLAIDIIDGKVIVSQPDSRLSKDKVQETQELVDKLIATTSTGEKK